MGHRACARRRGAGGGPARARDDRGRRAGGRRDRRWSARGDRLPAARDAADLGRGVDRRLAAAAGRDAAASGRSRHDRPGARRRRADRHAGRGARRRIGGAALPRDVGRPEDRAQHEGAPRVHGRPGGTAGVGARAARTPPDPPAGRRLGAGRSGPPGAVPRRAGARGARLAAPPRGRATTADGRAEAGGGARPLTTPRGPQPPPRRSGDRAGRGHHRARPLPARSHVAAAPGPQDRRRPPLRAGRPHGRSPGGAHRGGRRDPAATRGAQRPAPALRLRDHPRPRPGRRARRHGARRDLPDRRRPGGGSCAAVGHPPLRPGSGAAVRQRQPRGAARGRRRPDRPGAALRAHAAGHPAAPASPGSPTTRTPGSGARTSSSTSDVTAPWT